ncbi:probable inactive protein kinase DDB_G0270444 isoform X2 [Chironomus tepperi]|uniref:probable inactive protein kinase DDB_G0270444 isoform X2 n=1 Tax=Chironomus tepperi TaxID=113505 RepID=UPI00391F41BD
MIRNFESVGIDAISEAPNEAVPPVEVVDRNRKGWTLFGSNKSRSEQNANREIPNDVPNNVKVIRVQPRNFRNNATGEPLDEDNSPDEIANPPSSNGGSSNGIAELSTDENGAVPKKRWYQRFGIGTSKKDKKAESPTVSENLVLNREASSASESSAVEARSNSLPNNVDAIDNDPSEVAVIEFREPEKKPGFFSNLFRRSKMNKKHKLVVPIVTVQVIDITPEEDNTDIVFDFNVQPAEDIEAGGSMIVEAEISPINDEMVEEDAKDEAKNASIDEPKEGSANDAKSMIVEAEISPINGKLVEQDANGETKVDPIDEPKEGSVVIVEAEISPINGKLVKQDANGETKVGSVSPIDEPKEGAANDDNAVIVEAEISPINGKLVKEDAKDEINVGSVDPIDEPKEGAANDDNAVIVEAEISPINGKLVKEDAKDEAKVGSDSPIDEPKEGSVNDDNAVIVEAEISPINNQLVEEVVNDETENASINEPNEGSVNNDSAVHSEAVAEPSEVRNGFNIRIEVSSPEESPENVARVNGNGNNINGTNGNLLNIPRSFDDFFGEAISAENYANSRYLRPDILPCENRAEIQEVPEIVIGDNASVGDVESFNGSNNDENLSFDDDAEVRRINNIEC